MGTLCTAAMRTESLHDLPACLESLTTQENSCKQQQKKTQHKTDEQNKNKIKGVGVGERPWFGQRQRATIASRDI